MLGDKLSMRQPAMGSDTGRYRINFLNPDGTIFRTKSVKASSDAEAIQYARQFMDGRALDLWDGLRFIEFFPTLDKSGKL